MCKKSRDRGVWLELHIVQADAVQASPLPALIMHLNPSLPRSSGKGDRAIWRPQLGEDVYYGGVKAPVALGTWNKGY